MIRTFRNHEKQNTWIILFIATVSVFFWGCSTPASEEKPAVVPPVENCVPGNGESTFVTTPTLSWKTVTDATGYEFAIATTDADLESASAISLTNAYYTLPSALTVGQTYYWRYRAITGSGTGDWDFTHSLTIAAVDATNDNPVTYPFELAYIGKTSALWDKNFILTRDIDLAEWDGTISPIGGAYPQYTGIFNGANHTVSNLTISGATDNQGLFGYVYEGEVKNLVLISPTVSGSKNTASLVGYLRSSVMDNCSASSATVTGTDSVGGLIGYAHSSTIKGSYAEGSVTGTTFVGGLAGSAWYGTDLNNSYGRCSIEASSNYAGGLVGYSCGKFSSNSSMSAVNCTYAHCYSVNVSLSASQYKGACFGFAEWGYAVTQVFFDSDVATTISATDSFAAGKSSLDMKTTGTFTSAGWDFIDESANGNDNLWARSASINNGYPYLVKNLPQY